MSKLRTNVIENLDSTNSINVNDIEIKQESYINLGDYDTIVTPVNYNNSITVDGITYRLKTSTAAPYNITGNWGVDGSAFVPTGDAVLRQELGDETNPSKGANMVGYSGRRLTAKLSETVSPQDKGAAGDGVADDLQNLQAAVNTGAHVVGTPSSTYKISSALVAQSSSSIDMRGSQLVLAGGDSHVLQVGDSLTVPQGVRLSNVRASGPDSQPSNDYAVLNTYKADGAVITGVEVVDGYNSMTLEYGEASGTERRTVNTVLQGAILRGAYIGLETFSLAHSAVAGLIASRKGKTRGLQHGMRVTGYGQNHLGMGFDMRNRGNCYGPVVINNYANGVSQQTGAFSNVLTYAVTDCENGLSTPIVTGLDQDVMSASNNHSFAISGCEDGADIVHPLASVFRGTIADCSGFGFYSRLPLDKQSRGNIYDLSITKTAGTSAYFGDSSSHIRLAIKDVVNGAVIAGNYNIVDVVADNINYLGGNSNGALTISGSNNLVRIVADDVKQTFNEIVVSGSNNTVEVLLDASGSDGKVAVTGSGNTIRGRCFITTGSSAANDYSGVLGWSGRGVASVTTDASGIASIPITAGIASMFADARYVGSDADRQVVVRSTSTAAISVKVLTAAGVAVANTTMSLRYFFECYK